jgi:SAM-dependent methyltransferase
VTTHPEAERRYHFDRDPDTYQRSRPPYPAEVYDLLARDGLAPGCRVLEIGAGTGQATEELLRRGADVVAVEPGPAMASTLANRHRSDRLQVVNADFEVAELPPGPYDFVVSATAFHWLDTDRALPRAAKLLAPEGTLAVWWTVFGDPERKTDFRAQLDRHYQRLLPHLWSAEIPGPLRTDSWVEHFQRGGHFGVPQVDLIRWTQRLTSESARGLWSTFSNILDLPEADRTTFLDTLGHLVNDFGGVVDDPRVTAVYRSRHLPGS